MVSIEPLMGCEIKSFMIVFPFCIFVIKKQRLAIACKTLVYFLTSASPENTFTTNSTAANTHAAIKQPCGIVPAVLSA